MQLQPRDERATRGSQRCLELAGAAERIAQLPAQIGKIAVLVNPGLDEALAAARRPFITGLQLHGTETPEFGARLAREGIRFAKALPVGDLSSLEDIPYYGTELVVLDSVSTGSFGGSGKTFPWRLARQFAAAYPRYHVILAGGR